MPVIKLFLALFFLAGSCIAQDLGFLKQIGQDSILIGVHNNLHAPLTIWFTPKQETQNMARGSGLIMQPLDTVQRVMAIPFSAVQDTTTINPLDYFDFKGFLGDSTQTIHDDNAVYRFPFEPNKRIKIIQSFGGKFTHNTPQSYYAIDFGTQIGDTIYAAREGRVVKTIDKFKEHGGQEFFSKANLIVIMHSDGTFANYIHLDYQGVFVKPGQMVAQGAPIGLSGMTGFTNIPHLHFMVRNANEESVPIYFKGLKGKKLKPNKKYRH